jgi:hypothetical protein
VLHVERTRSRRLRCTDRRRDNAARRGGHREKVVQKRCPAGLSARAAFAAAASTTSTVLRSAEKSAAVTAPRTSGGSVRCA